MSEESISIVDSEEDIPSTPSSSDHDQPYKELFDQRSESGSESVHSGNWRAEFSARVQRFKEEKEDRTYIPRSTKALNYEISTITTRSSKQILHTPANTVASADIMQEQPSKEKEATNALVPTSRPITTGDRISSSCFILSIESKNFAYNERKKCFITSVIMTDKRHLDGIALSYPIVLANQIPIAAACRNNRHVREEIARAAFLESVTHGQIAPSIGKATSSNYDPMLTAYFE